MGLTVGTAGHIDHGKTWLVRALTGKDTDRLPEEQRRGISIDLGYAPLRLERRHRALARRRPGARALRAHDGRRAPPASTSSSSSSTAGEGARPQTHEHLAILRLLGVARGRRRGHEGGCRRARSARARRRRGAGARPGRGGGAGLGQDRPRAGRHSAPRSAAPRPRVEARPQARPTRLYVDRSFSLRGIGTVVTGTLWSGSIGEGDVLVVAARAAARRGCGACRCTTRRSTGPRRDAASRWRCRASSAAEVRARRRRSSHRARTRPRSGSTSRSRSSSRSPTARASRCTTARGGSPPGSSGPASGLRAAAARRARRRRARRPGRAARAAATLGGATVLDPAPPRHRDAERLAAARGGRHRGDDPRARAPRGAPARARRRGRSASSSAGPWAFSRAWLDGARGRSAVARSPRPTRSIPGVPVPAEPWAADVVPLLPFERRGAKLYLPGAVASLGAREAAAERRSSRRWRRPG